MVRCGDTCDVDAIVMGNEVNVQDLACIHQTEGKPVVIEDGASIGHAAVFMVQPFAKMPSSV